MGWTDFVEYLEIAVLLVKSKSAMLLTSTVELS